MIYRILGAMSLAIGGIFALIAALILLPFLSNFNLGLLVLSGVFGIIGYVLLSVGWQLFHPPEETGDLGEQELYAPRARASSSDSQPKADKEALEPESGALSEASGAEPSWEVEETAAAESSGRGNGGSRAEPANGEEETAPVFLEEEGQEDRSGEEDSDEHLLGAHEGFKKQGSVIPPEEKK